VRIAHHDDVEPHGQLREIRTLLQELARGAGDAPLFAPVDAAAAPPNAALERVRTSAMTSSCARRAMRSSSPSRRR